MRINPRAHWHMALTALAALFFLPIAGQAAALGTAPSADGGAALSAEHGGLTPQDFIEYASLNDEDIHQLYFSVILYEGTESCMMCHEETAKAYLDTGHFKWQGKSERIVGFENGTYGKNQLINNFCIGISSNWPACTQCHIGYGWKDDSFDFASEANVDCLVCHDTTGEYKKIPGLSGHPNYERMEWPPHSGKFREPVDLKKVAQNVGKTSRATCGACHGASY